MLPTWQCRHFISKHFKNLKNGQSISNWFSTQSSHLDVNVSAETGLATLLLQKPPVNSLNQDFLIGIANSVKNLESDASVTGILITSKFHGKVFSAGLDLPELYNKSDSHLAEFWRSVQQWCRSVFGCSKPVVAALNGHAIAGGCGMALMCDYRVMGPGLRIGLNEVRMGIPVPLLCDLLSNAVNIRQSEYALTTGKIFSTTDAFAIGLVDELADFDRIQSVAEERLLAMSKVPSSGYEATKNCLRASILGQLSRNSEVDVAGFVKTVQSCTVQRTLEHHLRLLKGNA